MKAIIGGAAGVLALGGALLLANARSTPPAVQASGPAATVASASALNPLLVNCGEGRQPLMRPVVPGQPFSQVECVPAPVMAPQLVPMANYLVPPGSYPTVTDNVVYRDRVVYQDRPVYRTASSNRTSYRRASYSPYRSSTDSRRMRSWKKSALIIGGSAAGGAGVGAILGGKSGAKKGAIVGGVGGLVYDLATRNKER